MTPILGVSDHPNDQLLVEPSTESAARFLNIHKQIMLK